MWFEFDQNNSGGFFECDDKVCATVWIEADTVHEATAKAQDLGIYFDGVSLGRDCECCGDRWSIPWEGEESPVLFDWRTRWTEPAVRKYYKYGKVEEL